MKKKLIVLSLLSIVLVSFAQDVNWKLKKDKEGIKVYTFYDETSGELAFKAIAEFDASIEQLTQYFAKADECKNWQADIKESYSLDQSHLINDGHSLDYTVVDLPWPFKDRDAVIIQTYTTPNDSTAIVEYLSQPDKMELQDDCERINQSKGIWTFTDLGANRTRIQHVNYTLNEFPVPVWIINLFIEEGPCKTFMNLREKMED